MKLPCLRSLRCRPAAPILVILLMLPIGTGWATDVPDSTPLSRADQIYHVLVAEFAVRRGRLATALEHYRRVVDVSDDPQLAERAARIALYVNDAPALLAFAQRWHDLAPDDNQAGQTLILGLLKNDRIDAVGEHIEQVRAVFAERDGQDGFAGLNNLLSQIDDRWVVLQAMELASATHPESPFAAYYLALAALDARQPDTALDALEQALERRPAWREALLLQAQVRLQAEKTELAVAGLADAVEADPDNTELRLGYARVLVAADLLEQAREQFAWLADNNPDDPEALFALGVLATEAEQYDVAEEYFERLLALDRRVSESRFELGRLNELRGDYAMALDWYAQVETEDRYLNAQVRAATMEAHLDDFEAMAERLIRLRLDYPDNAVSLYIAEAQILREESRYQAAYDILDAALRENPDNHDLLYSRALAAERLDRLDRLERDLRRILDDDPDNAHALNALGYTLTDRTDRHEEAYQLIERALELLPDDPAILDSMGWVKYRLGDAEGALPYLRRAYALTDEPEIIMHLSEVLWELGEHDEAREIWEAAYEQFPDDEYLLRLKDLFRP